MPMQPDFRRLWVPIAGFFWGACMTLAGLVARVMDYTTLVVSFPMGIFVVLALPGFLLGAVWLLAHKGPHFH